MAIEKVLGIVSDVVKYSDRHNIVTMFAREHGRIALLSPAGNSKSARMRNAALMPLSVISTDINFNPTRDLQFLGKFSREYLWKDIYFNPVKSAIGMFIAEFINAYVRQSPPDPQLWNFFVRSIATLDNASHGIANFHIAFLLECLEYVGIRPDLSEWSTDKWFDMQGGAMTIFPPSHNNKLTPLQASQLPLLTRMNMRTAHLFKFSATQRREILLTLLGYYSTHFPGLSNLKSPAILAEVFGN